MDDRNLLKLCIFCSILGLVILFVGVQQVEAKVTDIGSISEGEIGKLVSVEGTVYSSYYNGEHLFFTLEDRTGRIKVVVFENLIDRLNIDPRGIKKGIELRVDGEVEKYRGELEILPERIYL
ncbi:MAG: OB-fold nucleic acid binding domain-containing protein [archaeon]|nr:MAG: OB-fold nucleic acid binding domain-containing protein [archaeon]